MQLKWIHIVLFVSAGVLLSSCYCFKNTYTASPVDLKSRSTPASAMPCCEHLNSKSLSITPYYAFINRDLFDQTLPSFYNKSIGQLGLQTHYLYRPIRRIPFNLASIGLDYSFHSIDNYFIGTAIQATDLDRTTHRVMLSHNFATLVSPKFLGYISTQIGYKINVDKFTLPTKKTKTSYILDGRIGYNLNYFLTKNIVLLGEAGYGGGNYLKTGISFWF